MSENALAEPKIGENRGDAVSDNTVEKQRGAAGDNTPGKHRGAKPATTAGKQPRRRARQTKALAKADAPPVPKEGWPLDGMTPEQAEEAEALKAIISARPKRANATLKKRGDALSITIGNPDIPGNDVLNSIRLYAASGSASSRFGGMMLQRIVEACRPTGNEEMDSDRATSAIAMIAAIEPQNELEATMALQMVAANEAVMHCFRRSRSAQYMEQATAYSNMANKAMRSFALHAEAIAKLRRGGEQVVKHVHVNDGGQAVIAGTVNTGRGA